MSSTFGNDLVPHDALDFELEELDMAARREITGVTPSEIPMVGILRPLVDAQTDSELARTYIHRPGLSDTTIENIRKELYRFLKWCREERAKQLRSLVIEDVQAYFVFIKDPQPAERWVSPKKEPRFLPHPADPEQRIKNPAYRPFSGPLKESSQRHAQVVVKAFLKWAHKVRYLADNPAALVDLIRPGGDGDGADFASIGAHNLDVCERFLSKAVIDHVLHTADALPLDQRNLRDRFLLYAYFHTGARLSELVNAKMGMIYRAYDGRWWLNILGKGKKRRRVPVPRPMLEAFRDYRRAFGYPTDPLRTDPLPLILSTKVRPNRTVQVPVTPETAARAVIRLFELAATSAGDLEEGNAKDRLREATTHWLRHSLFTWLVNNGVSVKRVQEQAGHEDISTTGIYLHDEANARHDEISALLED